MSRWILCSVLAITCSSLAYGQTEPPPNDTCAGAIEFVCGQTINQTIDTSFATNDYQLPDLGSCTGFNSAGPDIVYTIVIPPGGTVNFTLNTTPPNGTGFDGSIYLITDCDDPTGSCLAGGDGCNALAEVDAFGYTNETASTQTTFLIVDGFVATMEGGCGTPFGQGLLTGSVTCPPPPTTGACCFADDCFISTGAECDASGGNYLGNGTGCATCPAQTGACCYMAQPCAITTEADCGTTGGSYLGNGTSCAQCPVAVEPTTWGGIKNIYKESD